MSTDDVSRLLAMLGPVVMGALARQQNQDGSGATDLAAMLGSAEQRARAMPGGSALAGLLDGDGDGDVDAADLTRLGTGLLGSFFK